jgi:hypothetical protein
MNRSATAFLLTLASLPAQRPEATFEWQKRTTTIAYGAVPVGKHGLGELPVGETWRLGFNEASTMQLSMPMFAGDAWVAPGHYRINLVRTDETHCNIAVAGSQHAVGSSEGRVPGEIKKAAKPGKKLSIEWAKNGAPVAGNQSAKIVVQFGENEWQGEVLLLGNKTVNVPGGRLAVFSVPAQRIDAREKEPVPIAVLSKGKDGDQGSWNLVLGKSDVHLVPWMEAPTEQFGFGAITPPDEKQKTAGTVTASPLGTDAALEAMELRESSLAKGELRLVVACGKESFEIKVPEPKIKSGK